MGHIVGRDGLQPDPKKIKKMKNLPSSQTLTQLKAAVGLFSYYRKVYTTICENSKTYDRVDDKTTGI